MIRPEKNLPGSSIPERAALWALGKVGCPYSQAKRMSVHPEIFDCSSLVYRAYRAQGYAFKTSNGGTSSNVLATDATGFELLWPASPHGIGVSFATLASARVTPRPGDVMYLCTDRKTARRNKITHVALFVDEDTIVHARGTAYGVRTDAAMLYDGRICAVTRFRDGAEITAPKLPPPGCGAAPPHPRQKAKSKEIRSLKEDVG